jgi:S-(hydroxymethyl)glutathione dehydrogenase/alcohol dehydrogenase
LSEYTLVKSSALVLNTSEKMSFAAASIIGCGVMTGYGSVMNAARLKPGSSAVVLGAGGRAQCDPGRKDSGSGKDHCHRYE